MNLKEAAIIMFIEIRKNALLVFLFAFAFVLIGVRNVLAAPPTIGTIPDKTDFMDQPIHGISLVLNDMEKTDAFLPQPGRASDNQSLVPNESIFPVMRTIHSHHKS